MKGKNLIIKLIIFSILVNISCPAFAADTSAAPYEKDEFPQFLQDLRRFEIISLGAMPFVTLNTSLAYSTVRYARNDFNSEYTPSLSNASSFDTDEQIGIILTSLGISLSIGLTDLVINLIKRSSKKRNNKSDNKFINIIPLSEDPDAVLISIPQVEAENEEVIEVEE